MDEEEGKDDDLEQAGGPQENSCAADAGKVVRQLFAIKSGFLTVLIT